MQPPAAFTLYQECIIWLFVLFENALLFQLKLNIKTDSPPATGLGRICPSSEEEQELYCLSSAILLLGV
jgi:hypothetical protein